MSRSTVGLFVLVLALAVPVGAEELVSEESKEMASSGALGAAAGLTSVVYAPVKVVYAAGGSVVAGLAWVLSGGDSEVAKPILDASVRGDYVVTPEHMRGEKTIEFVGRPAESAPYGSSEPEPDVAADKTARDANTGSSWK
jgi:hypothetical protein